MTNEYGLTPDQFKRFSELANAKFSTWPAGLYATGTGLGFCGEVVYAGISEWVKQQ